MSQSNFDARGILGVLRRGEHPEPGAMTWFANALADGRVTDAQAGAFAMAVCMHGLSHAARTELTVAMRDTGAVLQWDLPGAVVDKHSTGGVGDCVSLVLAPALAACGVFVPMISGRGLGHTGGTLDKLESIPGVKTQIDGDLFSNTVASVGCAIVGATAEIAPADKRLYGIRDVTGTVDSLDLITASILSKKLAASPNALVLDVKVGAGAFMKTIDEARSLARSLVTTANEAGCPTAALITNMNQPLVPSLGNNLEVREVMHVLTQKCSDSAIGELTVALGGMVLLQAGRVQAAQDGAQLLRDAINDGRALDRFCRMITALGGPDDFEQDWDAYLTAAPSVTDVISLNAGFVTACDGEALGHLVVKLGGGRLIESDEIDPTVGISDLVRLGQYVAEGDVIARIHSACADVAPEAVAHVQAAVTISSEAPEVKPLIYEKIL